MILSSDGLVAFHYKSYGTFFYNKIGSILSTGDLPTINSIEPDKKSCDLFPMFHKEQPDYNRRQYGFYTIDKLVPKDHFLQQVD